MTPHLDMPTWQALPDLQELTVCEVWQQSEVDLSRSEGACPALQSMALQPDCQRSAGIVGLSLQQLQLLVAGRAAGAGEIVIYERCEAVVRVQHLRRVRSCTSAVRTHSSA